MRWLVALVTPPGGVVLDPFAGSASTGIAAVMEDRVFLGIEREPKYLDIGCARLTHWARELSRSRREGWAASTAGGRARAFLPAVMAIQYLPQGGSPSWQSPRHRKSTRRSSGASPPAPTRPTPSRHLAEETGRPFDSLSGSYYSWKRKLEGGEPNAKPSRTRRRETTPDDALADARAALQRAIEAIDREVETAKTRAEEAKAEHEALKASASDRKKAITDRLEALK